MLIDDDSDVQTVLQELLKQCCQRYRVRDGKHVTLQRAEFLIASFLRGMSENILLENKTRYFIDALRVERQAGKRGVSTNRSPSCPRVMRK